MGSASDQLETTSHHHRSQDTPSAETTSMLRHQHAPEHPMSLDQSYPRSPLRWSSSAAKLTTVSEASTAFWQDMEMDPTQNDSEASLATLVSPSSVALGSHGSEFAFEHRKQRCEYAHPKTQMMTRPAATPLTRFLSKQTLGFIPRSPSFSSADNNAAGPSPTASGSPLSSPLSSPSLAVGPTPSGFHLPSLTSMGISPPSTPPSATASGHSFTLAPLKHGCTSPPTTPLPSLPAITGWGPGGERCSPFRYQRSLSCPSDVMAVQRAIQVGFTREGNNSVDSTSSMNAYYASSAQEVDTEVPMARVERSSSMDINTILSMRKVQHQKLHGESFQETPHPESIHLHRWLGNNNPDQYPLASLAESAHAVQLLQQRHHHYYDHHHAHDHHEELEPAVPFASSRIEPTRAPSSLTDVRREKKLCMHPDCASNAVTRGLCISHGGGRRCQRRDCTRGAQSKGLCVAHGGGRICRAKKCSNIQRSMGLCIRHGGGKRCSVPDCQKGVVRQDLCTAHGGKRKCKVEDCNKHVKKKGLCRAHANAVHGSSSSSSSPMVVGSSSPRNSAISSGGSSPEGE